MVSLRDQWITPQERDRCVALAYEIDGLGKQLLEDVEAVPRKEGEPGHFIRRYKSGKITVENTGPEKIPTNGWSFCSFVCLSGRIVTRQIDTTPAILECDLDVAEAVLVDLERLVEEKRLDALRAQAGVTS